MPLEGKGFVVMLAGVLDDDPGTKAFRRIFTRDSPRWYEDADELAEFAERPPASETIWPKPAK